MNPDDWTEKQANSFMKAVETWGENRDQIAASNKKFQEILELQKALLEHQREILSALKEDYEWRKSQEVSCKDCRLQLSDIAKLIKDACDQKLTCRWWSKEILVPVLVAFIALAGVIWQGRATQERVTQGQQKVINQLAGGQMEIGKALGDMWIQVKEQNK